MCSIVASKRGWWRKAFSLCCAIYAILWSGATWFLCYTFGTKGTAVLSLVLLTPLLIAARMCWRWAALRRREFVFLAILVACVLTGGGYVVSCWYDKCLDLQRATEAQFTQLTKLVRQDPAFCGVELQTPLYHRKDSYHIRGTVASQADLERLQALAKQYGFSDSLQEVAVCSEHKSK